MAAKPDDHAGSGLDKPDPKTLLETAKDGIKAFLPKTVEAAAMAAPALQDGTEAPLQK